MARSLVILGLGMVNDHLGTAFTRYEDITKGDGSKLIKHFMEPSNG
jgi:hypothetical protein